MAIGEHITDHVTRAQGDLLSQFGSAARLLKFLEILVAEVQELEDVMVEVRDEIALDVAEGVQLDNIWGKMAQELRGAITDDDEYRRILEVVVAAFQSDGDVPTTIQLAAQLTQLGVRLRQLGRAFYLLELAEHVTPFSLDFAFRLISILNILPPSGVGYQTVEGITPAFRFDTVGGGFDQGNKFSRSFGSE